MTNSLPTINTVFSRYRTLWLSITLGKNSLPITQVDQAQDAGFLTLRLLVTV